MPKNRSVSKPYRSKLEVLTAALLNSAKIKFKYETLTLHFVGPVQGGICSKCGDGKGVGKKRRYLADFHLVGDDRVRCVVEAKGRLTSAERTKFLAIRKSNPDYTIYFVFGSDNKLNKHKEKRYSDWCNEHGFEFGIKSLPSGLVKGKADASE